MATSHASSGISFAWLVSSWSAVDTDDFCSVELESPSVELPGEPQPRNVNTVMVSNQRKGAKFFIERYNQVLVAERSEKICIKKPADTAGFNKGKIVAHRVKGLSACSLASLVAKPLECRAIGEKSPLNSH